MVWVTPILLMLLLGAWVVQDVQEDSSLILMSGIDMKAKIIGWSSRALIYVLFMVTLMLVWAGWRRQRLPAADREEDGS
jgi:hypothetical protein